MGFNPLQEPSEVRFIHPRGLGSSLQDGTHIMSTAVIWIISLLAASTLSLLVAVALLWRYPSAPLAFRDVPILDEDYPLPAVVPDAPPLHWITAEVVNGMQADRERLMETLRALSLNEMGTLFPALDSVDRIHLLERLLVAGVPLKRAQLAPDMSDTTFSKNKAILRAAGLLVSQGASVNMTYSVHPDHLERLTELLIDEAVQSPATESTVA